MISSLFFGSELERGCADSDKAASFTIKHRVRTDRVFFRRMRHQRMKEESNLLAYSTFLGFREGGV
jgi:hypothetical protein